MAGMTSSSYGIYKAPLKNSHGGWIKLIDEKVVFEVLFCRGLEDVIQWEPMQGLAAITVGSFLKASPT